MSTKESTWPSRGCRTEKAPALLEDMKPWFGSNAKSLGFFSILQLLTFLFQVESNALLINYLDHCSTWLKDPVTWMAAPKRIIWLFMYLDWSCRTREKRVEATASWGSRVWWQCASWGFELKNTKQVWCRAHCHARRTIPRTWGKSSVEVLYQHSSRAVGFIGIWSR